MELTPKLLTTVEFADKRRGYDPDEVRAFLAEVAKSMEALQTRVREAETKASEAKAAPPSPGTPSAEDVAEQARRTLVLAQRTADAAIAEAKEQAARIMAEAEATTSAQRARADAESQGATERAQAFAERALRDAQSRASQMLADADNQARAESVGLRESLRVEIEGLTLARDTLRGDIERLDAYLSAQRERVRTSIDAMQHVLDHPEALAASEPPVDSAIVVPDPTPAGTLAVPEVPPPTEALEPPPPLGETIAPADEGSTEGDRSGDEPVLEPTLAVPRVSDERPEALETRDPTPASGIPRAEPPPAPEPEPDPAPAPDEPTVVAQRPVAAGADSHDPLLSGEAEPFDDEQLVRSFFDPKRPTGEGWRRRRRE